MFEHKPALKISPTLDDTDNVPDVYAHIREVMGNKPVIPATMLLHLFRTKGRRASSPYIH